MKTRFPPRIEVTRSATIQRPATDLYRFWRSPENLGRVMDQRVAVTTSSTTKSRWAARVPGHVIEWEAEITRDDPDRAIEWKSCDGAPVANSGVVRFEPAGGGQKTVVTVSFEIEPGEGRLVSLAGPLAHRAIARETDAILRRLKSLAEEDPKFPFAKS